MANFSKPSDINKVWSNAGDNLTPSDAKINGGWAVEIPPRQWFNWLDNKQDQAIAHINQHGIAVWDAATEYQYEALGEKSLVMGSDGAIYRTLTTNTNQDPTATVGVHWEIAFSNAGDFYTKVESAALYLAKAQNLADLTNTATARTNLSVYSQAETYTKTEVDGKTTVASTAQAQGWTSNTTLMTPLRLAEAFQGANRSHLQSGYQKLPGGLIIQWGNANTDTTGTTHSYPLAFPSSVFQVIASDASVTTMEYIAVQSISTTQFNAKSNSGTPGFSFIAIGI